MTTYRKNPMYLYLIVLTLCATGGLQTWRTLFDNFAVQIVHLDGYHVGVIQSIRELPGFLALLVVYALLYIKEHRLAALSVLIFGIGICLTGFFPSYLGLIFTTLVMSFGFHYFETTNQSLTLQYFTENESPVVFGRLRSYSSACSVVVGIFFLLWAKHLSYTTMYSLCGMLIIVAAIAISFRNPTQEGMVVQKKSMVFKKRYWLFYILTFLAGARRQLFIAFASFLLVKKFEYSISDIAALFLVNNVVIFFLSPLIGKWIVRFGERKVLSLEYGGLILVFCGYALVEDKYLAAFLYILDHIFINFAIAIKTFFQKIGSPSDIAPSMAVGFTINHVAAVFLPALGGLLWLIDYTIVFYGGALLALLSLVAVQFIPAEIRKARKIVQDRVGPAEQAAK